MDSGDRHAQNPARMNLPTEPPEFEPLWRTAPQVYVVDFIGAVLAALGIFGTRADNPGEWLPFLADRNVALGCLGAGIVLMACALWQILRHFKSLIGKDHLTRHR